MQEGVSMGNQTAAAQGNFRAEIGGPTLATGPAVTTRISLSVPPVGEPSRKAIASQVSKLEEILEYLKALYR